MGDGPRIYNLFPLLAGTVRAWRTHLPRIAAMGFDWVFVNPVQLAGFSGSLYAVKDPFVLDPRFRGRATKPDDALFRDFVAAAERQGLGILIDLVVNHTAKDAPLVERHPGWFLHDEDGAVRSPRAIDPDDARKVTVWGDLAEIDYGPRPERAAIVDYWRQVVRHYVGLGIHGFRCDAAYKVPGEVWAEIIAAARAPDREVLFLAETLGCRLDEIAQLAPAGFDYLFNSAKWWDFEADWLLDQYEEFRHVAPSIAFPESHDTDRLAAELMAAGIDDARRIEAAYRQRYLFAAMFSSGVMMPMGYEFGFVDKLDVVRMRDFGGENKRFDLSSFVAETNRLKARIPLLNEEGPQMRIPCQAGVLLVRRAREGPDWTLTAINPDPERERDVAPIDAALGEALLAAAEDVTPDGAGIRHRGAGDYRLPPFGIRVLRGREAMTLPIDRLSDEARNAGCGGIEILSAPIVVQHVRPELDCGRYPVKREVGDLMTVSADIFREGHARIDAALLYRAIDAGEWQEVPMRLVDPGLDRWAGEFALAENGRYLYTIEAWPDPFESWREEVQKKRAARQVISLELVEGRLLVAAARSRAEGDDARRLERFLASFDAAPGEEERAAILDSVLLRQVMARTADRSAAVRYDHVLEVVVDRERARFAAWYEMFPRSQGTEPGKSATFADCVQRLPDIHRMGFDVVYLPPIHPIGNKHRKGRNNAREADDGDPGSPYAIGSEAGGHDAIHPELGTLEDFRSFVCAANDLGLEIALDFAIQCAPDHPWVRAHPEWFSFRPDGTIKHAENPPKKYEDIVTLEFYGPHRDALWRTLRDVVLFWIDEGVRIFRVDNPHTKPVPLWEWMIRDIQTAHPDVIFLSEAFTRPRMLEMLAKVGFSQSYTYFTWRDFKAELTQYLTALTQGEASEYLRPNLFTNTPDILPGFLQTGGRPAFRIRLVLAATLSSVYGIYNGFELCENKAVPGTEEYLDSEKYEYKVWDWDRPGNIRDYIARVNDIRRQNPALHELGNLRFSEASSDDVLFYGKATPARDNIVFVAVNLDPFEAHESDIIFPLADMGIPEKETYEVEELLTGEKHLWRGARQCVRLEPETNPAAIYRVTPWTHVDYREPCF